MQKTPIIVGSIVVFVILFIALIIIFYPGRGEPYIIPGEELIPGQELIQQEIAAAQFCEVRSDCIPVQSKCPFGCYVFVNFQERFRIQSLINDFETTCAYACAPLPGFDCVDGQCAVTETPEFQDQRESCSSAGGIWGAYDCKIDCEYRRAIANGEVYDCALIYEEGCECGQDNCWNQELNRCELTEFTIRSCTSNNECAPGERCYNTKVCSPPLVDEVASCGPQLGDLLCHVLCESDSDCNTLTPTCEVRAFFMGDAFENVNICV